MNQKSAMSTIDYLLKNEFKYIYKRVLDEPDIEQLVFEMDSKDYGLKMTLSYEDAYVDVMCFLSPCVLEENSAAYTEALRTINRLNWYAKAWGRFYIDDYNDLVYSLRLGYDVLETLPFECEKQIETAVDYFSDIFTPLIEVCTGKKTYEEVRSFIDAIWAPEEEELSQ